jgi:dihydrodipicolinate synthase/N-acetylneuraminate lyase
MDELSVIGRAAIEQAQPPSRARGCYRYRPVKSACELAGAPVGPTRTPVRLLDDDSRKRLATALANAGVTG